MEERDGKMVITTNAHQETLPTAEAARRKPARK